MAELLGSAAGDASHRELARTVRGHARRAGEPLDRGDIDDRACAGRLHGFSDALDAEPRADDVDVEDAAELLLRHVRDRGVAQDPGVVDEDVELAESLHSGRHGVGPVGRAGHVVVDVAADVGAQLVGDELSLVVEHVADDDPRPLGGEDPGV